MHTCRMHAAVVFNESENPAQRWKVILGSKERFTVKRIQLEMDDKMKTLETVE